MCVYKWTYVRKLVYLCLLPYKHSSLYKRQSVAEENKKSGKEGTLSSGQTDWNNDTVNHLRPINISKLQ